MATVNPVFNVGTAATNAGHASGDGSVVTFTYTLSASNADGAGICFVEWADITVIATGGWGTSTLKVQGSADGTTWVTTGLSNADTMAEFSATGDKIATLIERPLYIRPILTTPTGATAVVVTFVMRRANPMRQ